MRGELSPFFFSFAPPFSLVLAFLKNSKKEPRGKGTFGFWKQEGVEDRAARSIEKRASETHQQRYRIPGFDPLKFLM